jgi:ankyrin repeat protein
VHCRPSEHARAGTAGVDLLLAEKEGYLEVVRALLEVGGREIAMMTRENGVSCLYISAENGHLDVVKALLEAGGRELVMLTAGNGESCLLDSAAKWHLDVVKALLKVGKLVVLMHCSTQHQRLSTGTKRSARPARRG